LIWERASIARHECKIVVVSKNDRALDHTRKSPPA
jgi:hypothetical protein